MVLDVKQLKYGRDLGWPKPKYASKRSYGDAALEFEIGKGVKMPKRTIHMDTGMGADVPGAYPKFLLTCRIYC